MARILCVDDDEAIRTVLRENLEETYEIIETGDATEALALALQRKPDAILLDLMMPGYTGFELCQTLSSISAVQLIPVVIISAYPAAEYKDFCLNLGAKEYFEKPVDFVLLRARLAEILKKKQPERRAEIRAPLRVILKLKGTDTSGRAFEFLTVTQDLSASGFRCSCPPLLGKGAIVDVFLSGGGSERTVGQARVVRAELPNTPWQQYGFRFVEKPREWVLR